MSRLRTLLPYLARHPWKLATGVTSIFLSVLVGLAAPLIVGGAIDAFRGGASMRSLLTYAALLVGVTAVQGGFSFAQRMILVSMSRDIELELRNQYFRHRETLPLGFYQERSIGDLMARATNDLQAVRMLCGPAIMYSSNTLFTALGATVLMWRIHWQLTLLALATMPAVAVATKIFGEQIHRLFEKVQEQFSALSTRVQENLAGVRVVRAYAQEVAERRSFATTNREYVERNRQLIRWSAAFHPLLQALVGVGFVLVLWRGMFLIEAGSITVGEFVSFNFFLSKLIWPMIAIGWVINLVQRGAASLRRILDIVETEPTIRDEPPLVEARPARGAVSIRDLTFRYAPELEPVLSEISFEVAPEEIFGLLGPNGSGKTTLFRLLCTLLPIQPGTAHLAGADVSSNPDEVRRRIGITFQSPSLDDRLTVRENL
ncbi:MAG: ABC transporter transmembrane domain-containing protein, partial [Thermoanaerobaculia bacterium]|nr:ABC transporter transmembrane domain-containing protein [Thermoanaerobaculia bacterium]